MTDDLMQKYDWLKWEQWRRHLVVMWYEVYIFLTTIFKNLLASFEKKIYSSKQNPNQKKKVKY